MEKEQTTKNVVDFKEDGDTDMPDKAINVTECDDFQDNYSHVDSNVFYTTHNIPGPGIDHELFYSQISRSCKCTDNGDSEKFHDQDAKRKKFESGQLETRSNMNTGDDSCTSIVNSLTLDQPNTSARYQEPSTTKDKTPTIAEDPQIKEVLFNSTELCRTNCICNSSAHYVNGKLNVHNYKLPLYECNDLCTCKRSNNSIDNHGSNATNEVTNSNSVFLNEISNQLKNSNIVKCANRVIQYGPNESLTIWKHSKHVSKGYGVRSTRLIENGEFVCEYVGEVIGKSEARRRYDLYKRQFRQREVENCNFYIFHLKELASAVDSHLDERTSFDFAKPGDTANTLKTTEETPEHIDQTLVANNSKFVLPEIPTFEMLIDATQFGNVARYINHSCQPNCSVLPVRVNSIFPSLAIFAHQDIPAGEEITYDYAGLNDGGRDFEADAANNTAKEGITNSNKSDEINYYEKDSEEILDKNRKRCYCEQKKCRKFLPFLPL